jgi:glycosyltransferase involved in cell wall biosynthesis
MRDMKKFKVMHIITRLILGGAQENTLLTVEGLAASEDFEPCLVTGPALGPEGELISRAKRNGVRLITVPQMRRAINPVRDLSAYRRLCALIKEERPDIVHTHSSKAGILGRRAASKCAVPVVVHTIHGLPFHPYESGLLNFLYKRLEKRAAARSDLIITVADAMIEQAVAAGVASREKFETIYSGLEVELFRPMDADERGRARRELGLDDGDRVICKVARLFHLKGHEYLFAAMPAILEKIPNAKLILVGDGILRKNFEKKVKATGIGGKVIFAGLVAPQDIGKYVGASDVVVHCSLREGLARVLPQALLCEVPVVSYDVDGAREVVRDGVTGWLVAPQAVDALAEAVVEILSDRERAAAMGREGRRICEKMFDHREMVSKIASAYRRLLAAKGVLSDPA